MKWWICLLQSVLFSVIPIISFYLMEWMDRNPFEQIRTDAHWFNILIYELLAWMLFLALGKAKYALWTLNTIAMAAGLANHYVMAFRSTPLVPWDLFSIGTAASVASNYDFSLPINIIAILLCFLLLGLSMIPWKFAMPALRGKDKKLILKNIFMRGIVLAIFTINLCSFGKMLQDDDFQTKHRLYPYLFTPSVMVKYNGYAVTFVMDLEYLIVDKPDGYSIKECEEILESWDTKEEKKTDGQLPNIIVIMDEAFSDLAVLGDFETNQDYMPFFHSLQEGADNAVTGYLHVSVCGGNTADTEYEFLMGGSMAFLPAGSIPYQQYLRGDTLSMASDLAEMGYVTYAQHPYYASGWNRDKVYPWMGFDNLTFLPDYSSRSLIRKYVSDESDFDQIIRTYENKEDGSPMFLFNVTMQNHGGYTDTYDDFSNTITADDLNSDALDQYLTLVSLTDQALERLIAYFADVEEPTVIVFFGDHQPNDSVARPVLNANGMDDKNLTQEEQSLRYQVPYLIWANYDIDEARDVDMSVNYLAANVKKISGLSLTAYDSFLLALQKEYPVISSITTVDDSGDNSMYEDYRKLQYYRMFDYEK